MIIKLLDGMSVIQEFMKFIPLVFKVLKSVIWFFIFLILWICIFGLFYQVLGVGHGTEYKFISAITYLEDAWKMSIDGERGDLTGSYWDTNNEH